MRWHRNGNLMANNWIPFSPELALFPGGRNMPVTSPNAINGSEIMVTLCLVSQVLNFTPTSFFVPNWYHISRGVIETRKTRCGAPLTGWRRRGRQRVGPPDGDVRLGSPLTQRHLPPGCYILGILLWGHSTVSLTLCLNNCLFLFKCLRKLYWNSNICHYSKQP